MINHKPNYLLNTWELLLSLINHDNKTQYELGDVTFGRIKSLEGDVKDTAIELEFSKPPLNKSPKLYKYNRIRLDLIFARVLQDTTKYGYTMALRDEDGNYSPERIVDYLINTYKFNAREIDFQFNVIPSINPVGFYLEASNCNVAYQGRVFIPLIASLKERVILTDMDFIINNDPDD